MDEPGKLRALIDFADRREYDEVFARLAHGQLSDAEIAGLRDSADPEIRRLYELFRPLDASSKARFDAAVADAFPNAAQVRAAPSRRTRRWQTWAAAALAVAAVLVLYWLGTEPQPAPVQLVSLERTSPRNGNGATMLGSQGGKSDAVQIVTGICWHMQMGVPPTGRPPKSVRAYFVRGTDIVPWNVNWQLLPNDRLAPTEGCARLPVLSAGSWELVILSGHSRFGRGPDTAAATSCHEGSLGANWRCDRFPIQILPLPPSPL